MLKRSVSYEAWKRAVDQELIKICGMDSDWLPDCYNYRQAYDDGLCWTTAARRALAAARRV